MEKRIGIGAVVRWTSQSGGIWKEKTGTVVRIVSAGAIPSISKGMARAHDSYLVEVREGKRRRMYWPHVAAIEVVKPSPMDSEESPALKQAMARRCTVYRGYCPEHDFIHGKEAELLRKRVEKYIVALYAADRIDLTSKEVSADLQHILDGVEACDSLAYLEANDDGTDEGPELYVVQDTRQIVGNCALWWSKDAKGYTCDLSEAHRYTEAEVRARRWRSTDIPRPLSGIRVTKHVRVENLPDEPTWVTHQGITREATP